jgi:hypothetical protein
MRRNLSASLLLALAFACKKTPPPEQPAQEAFDAGADEEVKPVYAAGESVPAAQHLCEALYQVQADRRAACCSTKPSPGLGLSQCVLTLSAAVRSGAAALDEAAINGCAEAESKLYQGCAWVGPSEPEVPAACRGLIKGTRKPGATCRSSLECLDGQTCLGVGPTQAGTCGAPKTDGQACRLSVDALADFVRDDENPRHPECAGFCGHYRCVARVAPGGSCHMASECPSGQRCDGTSCVAGAAAVAGEKCVSGSCADGLRCVGGTCKAPLADGAACKLDAECLGGCVAHACGQKCN